MKKLGKLKLSHMANDAINAKEMNYLKGGNDLSSCTCSFACACMMPPDIDRSSFDNEFANRDRADNEDMVASYGGYESYDYDEYGQV